MDAVFHSEIDVDLGGEYLSTVAFSARADVSVRACLIWGVVIASAVVKATDDDSNVVVGQIVSLADEDYNRAVELVRDSYDWS